MDSNNSGLTESSIFREFNSYDELKKYISRPQAEWSEEKGQFDFEQCVFNIKITFNNFISEFSDLACFQNACFNDEVSFENIIFKKLADFNGCRFLKDVTFKNAVFEDDVNACSFNGNVSFQNVNFKSSTFFWNHFRGIANFSNSTFTKNVDFSETVFEKEAYFPEATFMDKAFFEEAEFMEKVNAWKMQFKNGASFKWANFRKKVNMSGVTIEKGMLELHGVNFEGNAYYYDSNIDKLDLAKCVIEKGLYFLGAKIDNSNRESYRIIKHEFIKQSNKIEALKYHAREMEALRIELTEMKKSSIKHYLNSDKLILKINKYSNGYGLNPSVGLGFTLCWSLIFFMLYWISLKYHPTYFTKNTTMVDSFQGIGIVLSYFAEFISPTHSLKFMKEYLGNWSVLIDIISRIFIGFGIYQTIQAFRKYGRF